MCSEVSMWLSWVLASPRSSGWDWEVGYWVPGHWKRHRKHGSGLLASLAKARSVSEGLWRWWGWETLDLLHDFGQVAAHSQCLSFHMRAMGPSPPLVSMVAPTPAGLSLATVTQKKACHLLNHRCLFL